MKKYDFRRISAMLVLIFIVLMYLPVQPVSAQASHITLTKSVQESTYSQAGDVLHYTLVATNDGDTTLTNVAISDPLLGTLSCTPAQPATLAPGATLTATGSDTVQQSDVYAGKIDNTATTTSQLPGGGAGPTATKSKSIPAVQTPGLSLTKSANPNIYSAAGQVIVYNYEAKNTGNITLWGPFMITDDKLGNFQCGTATTLASGASITCTKSYTIQSGDLALSSITNSATVTGTYMINPPIIPGTYGPPPGNVVTSNTAFATITFTAPNLQVTKAVELAKDADGDGVASPGDTLKYMVTVKNTGSGAATGVTFSDLPDTNTTLVAGSVNATQGVVMKGNSIGDKTVEVAIGSLPPNGTTTIIFSVTINSPLFVSSIVNQGLVTGTNFTSVKSDDPSTQPVGDSTIINIKESPPIHGPGLSQWGVIILVVVFGGSIAWMIRRRQVKS
jgi:uncharacterized repeat protein (TIGR01451 family)